MKYVTCNQKLTRNQFSLPHDNQKQEGWLPPTERASAVKTRMNGLSCGEKIMTIRSAVLIQYQRVTDRLTDGQNLDS